MSKKLSMILCGLLAAAIISTSMAGCNSADSSSESASGQSAVEIDTNTQSETESSSSSKIDGSLQGVLDALKKDDSSYSTFKSSYPDAVFTETVNGDKLVITAKSDGEYDPNGSWEFVKDGDFITFHDGDSDDYTGTMLFMYVANAVADSLGMDPDLIAGYINGLSIMDIKSDKFVFTENEDGTHDIKLFMAAPFEMTELDQMIVDDMLLSDVEELDEESMNRTFSIGKVAINAHGDKKHFEIFVKEVGTLDAAAVKSVVNIVNAFKPDGYESFVENFTEFEDTNTETYTVESKADDETIMENIGYKDENSSYGFITFDSNNKEE